ncbi:MAG: hypothetical protein N2D54_06570, partial [Chloroflexota bacterium]
KDKEKNMFKSKKMDIAVFLLAFVVLVSSSGAAVAAPEAGSKQTRAQATPMKWLTLGGSSFSAELADASYRNFGGYLSSAGNPISALAPIKLPHNSIIKKMVLLIYDNSATKRGCAILYLSIPALRSNDVRKQVCTTDIYAANELKIKSKLVNIQVTQQMNPYVWVDISGTSVLVWAVKIGYKKP